MHRAVGVGGSCQAVGAATSKTGACTTSAMLLEPLNSCKGSKSTIGICPGLCARECMALVKTTVILLSSSAQAVVTILCHLTRDLHCCFDD
jgi:hypothetical protein